MPKWVYPLAFAFVLFLIYNDPSGSGDTAGNFAGFIVELLSAVGEFLTGLFEGTSDGTGAIDTTTSTSAGTVQSGSPDVVDSFTHTHDGTTHSHTSSTTTP